MMKKYLRWKAEWLCGIPHGSINWALVPACPSNLGKDLVLSACWCVFYFVFELFLSCSKLQWCVVEFQELWWDRHHWWQPMKATTLKQTVWTWMVRLPDSLCKHQQESELLWHLFCDAVTLCFRCAASDRRDSCLRSLWSTHWVDTKVALGFVGICRDLVCWTVVFVCFHGLVCFGVVFVADRNTDNTGWQHKKATTVWCQCEDRWID